MTSHTEEIKLQVDKYLEAAHSTDSRLFSQIVQDEGVFRMTMDEHGNGHLTGSAGALRFSGHPGLQRIGVATSPISVEFQDSGQGRIAYCATSNARSTSESVAGSFDPYTLVYSCSGLICPLCQASCRL